MKLMATILLAWLCSSAQAQGTAHRMIPANDTSIAGIIQGIWWSVEPEPSAAFQINDSTIYYPDMFLEYRYALSGDTLHVFRDEGVASSLIVKARKDTLILKAYDFEMIYIRKAEPPTH